jgi:hypothetical protein
MTRASNTSAVASYASGAYSMGSEQYRRRNDDRRGGFGGCRLVRDGGRVELAY